MTHDIFISYSSKDKPIADGICANLEAAGVRCWIAPRDIAPGEDWPTAISNAISSSRIMVLVFSASSNSSEDVSRELYLAANGGLVIIPFKIEDIKPRPGMEYYLARTHWLDAMNPPTSEQIAVLVTRVKSFIPTTERSEFKSGLPNSQPEPTITPNEKSVPPKKRFDWRFLWIPGALIILLSLASWFVFGQKKNTETKPSPTPTLDFTAKISGFGATLYEGPGESYSTIGPVLADMKITGQAYQCSWLKVTTSTDGKSGWVKADQLAFSIACADISAAEIPPTPTLDFTAKISGFGTTLYEGPGVTYATIGPVLADVRIIGQAFGCGWLKVVTSTDGKTGWLRSDKITFSVACADIPPAEIPVH